MDGWKSIAAHFGRERTTVMRWAAERGLPVHRIPGAGRGSVYALSEELDAWLSTSREDDAPEPQLPVRRPLRRKLMPVAALAALAAAALGYTVYARNGAPEQPGVAMPADREAAAIYVDARADWARRTPDSILAAIGKLQRVVAIEPGFSAGYSALADSFLLAREFGSIPDAEAFARAQVAVDTALKIDPSQASAHRAKGFIDYWWRGEREAAGMSFRRALALDPKAAQTHFWFANVLIDNGEFDEGMRRFAEARLLEPASPAIAADLAWARWSVGDTGPAKAALLDLRRDNPALATVPDYLSVIALAEGDVAGFVAEIEALAAMRRESGLSGYAAQLRAALAKGPDAVVDEVVGQALAEVERGERRTLVWPAFAASAAGDRAALLEVLRRADARREVWGSAGLLRHIGERWKRDTQVSALLFGRAAPAVLAPATAPVS